MCNSRLVFAAFLIISLPIGYGHGEEFRSWTTSNGQKTRIEMAAIELNGNSVRFKRKDDGREFTFPLNRLSQVDQELVRRQFNVDEPIASDSGAGESTNVNTGARWPAPVLNDDNIAEWATYLRPTEKDLVWRKIRWHNNLGEAQAEARRLNRPILLWTMNGNPCGET